MIFNRNKKRDEQHNSAVVLPSAENVFSDFIKNNPALTTNSFFEFKNTVDMMGSEDFCQFLRDDEE
ncbi:Uncharacterised protein [Shigella sonnei]|uniref:hypothetical protein n=1 Tax=Shigella sonnei TaxID=624 RepID=UPI0006640D9A|nr:hypothetical protein [Shigella sonnei]CSY10954.1 Uncharacterised protein [Shigella sonnei]